MAVQVNRDLCGYCGACVSVCPFMALELEDPILRIYPEKCTECGICVKMCPIGALSFPKKEPKIAKEEIVYGKQ